MKRIRNLAGRAMLLALAALLVLGAVNTASAGWAVFATRQELLGQRQGGELDGKLTALLGEPTAISAEDSEEAQGVSFENVTAEEAAAALSLLSDEEARTQADIERLEYDFASGKLMIFGAMDMWYLQMSREARLNQMLEEYELAPNEEAQRLEELKEEISKQIEAALQEHDESFELE